MRRLAFTLLGVLLLAPLAAADTIHLRDGRTVRGTVLGFINNRFAVRVAARGTSAAGTGTTAPRPAAAEEGEIVFFRPNEIERVEIEGRSLEDVRYLTRTVEVTLGPNWIDSGVDVRRNQRVQVRASGTIVAGRTRITPDGLRSTDPTAPLPRAAEGLLIGAVGNDPDSPVLELGLNREFVADRDGRLYLTANRGTYTDARGSFRVEVRTERDLTPRRRDDTARGRTDSARADEDEDNPFDIDNRNTNPAPVRARRPGGAAADAAPASRPAPREVTVTVPGNSRGVDTGVELRSGDQVSITASGSVVAGRRAGQVTPDGGRVGFGAIVGTYPLPNAGVGALIGYIRLANGQVAGPFLVGSQQSFAAQADGRLFLLVNDDNYADNSGSFTARITVNQ